MSKGNPDLASQNDMVTGVAPPAAPASDAGQATGTVSMGLLGPDYLKPGDEDNSPVLQYRLLTPTGFPRHWWDPSLKAQNILADFGATGWQSSIDVPAPDTGNDALTREIRRLVYLSQFRGANLSELVQQANNLPIVWQDLLMISPGSHPAHWELVCAGLEVGQLVAMHFKKQFNRPRPVQVYPALMPLIITPNHPSYPNAHATQSRLVAHCLTAVRPECEVLLTDLSVRVGRNREMAGVHYPSDTNAGFDLAAKIFKILDALGSFQQTVAEARQELQERAPAA